MSISREEEDLNDCLLDADDDFKEDITAGLCQTFPTKGAAIESNTKIGRKPKAAYSLSGQE